MSKQAQLKKANDNLFLNIYKIGDIYITTNSENPADRFGGQWEQIQDKFLLCAGNTYNAGSIGGEANHILTANEMPHHYHTVRIGWGDTEDANIGVSSGNGFKLRVDRGETTSAVGGNQPHNNMPPYLAVYVWKRIA